MTQPTLPTRLLFDPSKDTQHQYVPAAATDIRASFNRWRDQAKQQPQPLNVKTLRRNSK